MGSAGSFGTGGLGAGIGAITRPAHPAKTKKAANAAPLILLKIIPPPLPHVLLDLRALGLRIFRRLGLGLGLSRELVTLFACCIGLLLVDCAPLHTDKRQEQRKHGRHHAPQIRFDAIKHGYVSGDR